MEDIEALRVALGLDKIALYGTSYGVKVALGYALTYPANVERLVLDSVLEVDGPDPLYRPDARGGPARAALALPLGLPLVHLRPAGRPGPARAPHGRARAARTRWWTRAGAAAPRDSAAASCS